MHDEERIYRFGDIEVDPGAHRVTRMGREVALEPKAYAVLLALLARPGHAIERDDLLDQVWGHRHVTPGVLNRVVAQLRKALGDEAEHPRYIQTLHAVGYRFMAVPEVIVPDDVTAEISAAPAAEIFPFPGRSATGRTPVVALRDWLPHAVVVVAIVLALAWWQRLDGLPAGGGAAIALRPFTTLGGGTEDDAWFAEGLAVEMHDALASVPGLRVAALMAETDPRRDGDVRDLGRALGVDAVLDASIRRDGDRVRISARLSDTATGYVLWSRSYEHSMSELFATQGAIAGEVVESMLGAMPAARESLRTRLAPTRSVAAFDAYLRGRHLQRAAPDRARQQEAAEAFRAALAEDSGFVLAQSALCATEVRRFEYWNDTGAHARARLACARVQDADPMPAEAALALGNLDRVDGRFAEALRRFRLAAADPASAALAEVGMGKVEAARGQPDRARSHFQAALDVAPDDAQVRAEVGFQAYRDGRLEDATASYRRALELAPDNAGYWNTYGFLWLLQGNAAEAARAFERSIAIEPSADVLANFATLRSQAGEHDAALALYRRALELDPEDYLNWGNLADGLAASGAPASEVAAAYAEAERRVRRYLALDAGSGYAMAALGWYSANLGRREEALSMVARARVAEHGDPAEIALYNAETLSLLGDAAASDRELARARTSGMAEARIRASPVLGQ